MAETAAPRSQKTLRIAVILTLCVMAAVTAFNGIRLGVAEARKMARLVSEYRGTDDWAKRERILGPVAGFYRQCIDTTPPSARFFLVNATERTHYYGVYFLHPRELLIGSADVFTNGHFDAERFEAVKPALREQGVDVFLMLDEERSVARIIPLEPAEHD